MNARSYFGIHLLLFSLVIILSLLDLALYSSYLALFVSITTAFVLISLLILSDYLGNLSVIISFLITSYSLYCFTTAPYSLNLEENAFYTLGALILITLLIITTTGSSFQASIRFSGFDKFLIFVTLFSLILSNTLFNPDEIKEPQGMLKMITVGGSIILFTTYIPKYLYDNTDKLDFFLKVFVYIGIISGIYGILTVANPGLIPNNKFPGLATSFYKHPNATSSIYNFTIPVTIWFLIKKTKSLTLLEKFIFTSGLLISVVSLVFTFSRFGIAMVFLSALILFFKYSKKWFTVIIILSIVSFSFIIANFFSTKGSITILGRIGLIETAFEMYKDNLHFLFGYGGISSKFSFEQVKSALGVIDLNNNPHNIILYSIVLYGLFFTVALFLLFFKYYFKSITLYVRNRLSELGILSLAICSGVFLKNMGEDLLFFQEFYIWYIFLILFGFLLIDCSKETNNSNLS